jgi:hypothetical protein
MVLGDKHRAPLEHFLADPSNQTTFCAKLSQQAAYVVNGPDHIYRESNLM